MIINITINAIDPAIHGVLFNSFFLTGCVRVPLFIFVIYIMASVVFFKMGEDLNVAIIECMK